MKTKPQNTTPQNSHPCDLQVPNQSPSSPPSFSPLESQTHSIRSKHNQNSMSKTSTPQWGINSPPLALALALASPPAMSSA
jgi:hypothetical protein